MWRRCTWRRGSWRGIWGRGMQRRRSMTARHGVRGTLGPGIAVQRGMRRRCIWLRGRRRRSMRGRDAVIFGTACGGAARPHPAARIGCSAADRRPDTAADSDPPSHYPTFKRSSFLEATGRAGVGFTPATGQMAPRLLNLLPPCGTSAVSGAAWGGRILRTPFAREITGSDSTLST